MAGTGEIYNKHRDIWEFGMSMEVFVYIWLISLKIHDLSVII